MDEMEEAAMLDPQSRWVLDLVRRAARPPFHHLSPAAARRQFDATMAALEVRPVSVAAVSDIRISERERDVAMRVYAPHREQPGTGPMPALVFLHGGGWTLGSLDSHDPICRTLADRGQCIVASVEYRLAPEHKFPAAVEDAALALDWIARNS